MIEGLALALPMAAGIALSPAPVLAVVVILMTRKAGTNGPAFLVGWLVGIFGVCILVYFAPGVETASGEPTVLSGWVRVALGVVLLALGWRQWQRRPPPDAPVEVPKIIARLDQVGVPQAVFIGLLFSGLNVKNAALAAAGAASIDASGKEAMAVEIIALVVFTLVSSTTVIVPILGHYLARARTEAVLATWKDWLIRNSQVVVTVLLILFGVLLISRGLRIVGG